jgi:hypothetical protein
MLFYLTLCLGVLYFAIFRVRRKQEKRTAAARAEAFFANGALLTIVVYGFMTQAWYLVVIAAVLINIMASLILAAIQLGIFVDGKPLIGLSQLYKVMPILALSVAAGSITTIFYIG